MGHDREMDLFLAEADVLGSLAHTRMLNSIGLLGDEDLQAVQRELKKIHADIVAGRFTIDEGIEDVHSQVEFLLTERIGDAGKKIHSGRSRNDQVLVDLRIFLRRQIKEIVEDVESLTLGGATLRVYPPVGKKNQNEAGLTALCSAGSFDVLVTGDMPANTEKKLIADYDLPRVEVLLVGHHGSKYSSCEEFLRAVQPEYAIISVGSNSYGHPTAEAIGRLEDAGAEVYRTDEQGTILMKAEKAG